MKKRNYKTILYFIGFVIIVTIGIQIYWNYINYQSGKQQLINEVQISLDNAVDQYFTELAEENTISFITNDSANQINKTLRLDSLIQKIDISNNNFTRLDSIRFKIDTSYSDLDSLETCRHIENLTLRDTKSLRFSRNFILLKSKDSVQDVFKTLTSKIIVSLTQDSIGLQKIDTLLREELLRKKVNVTYGLKLDPERLPVKTLYDDVIASASLYTASKSAYLPKSSKLELYFTNEKLIIFKKNLLGILLSFLLAGTVIACLLFLLKIINHQKQLAELKNDLISNITHEFKTPIATISAALEAIQNFNQENDPEKTKKYVQMSSNQLEKLNTMVEKILETATLDSEELQLNIEKINLVNLIDSITKKHQTNSPSKQIVFTGIHDTIWKKVDPFHFENAINNIVDNAIKYGGDTIEVNLKNIKSTIILEVIDNGTSLTKAQKDKIFEKFYRVPKGNTHDVKGFGIGLFYTKTIIEKHGGTIELLLEQERTNFKITLPNG
ncbi:sensor histidine kinase [Aquimarina sp. SS2-1]|uniref:sensor histidine kinase n=1 Tax=Aquimarina besae TaxID=3342247 RepID=UPI003670DA23